MKLFSGRQSVLAFAGLMALFTSIARSAAALELGDTAPPVKLAEWIKGGPVSFEQGRGSNIFVLDFWDIDVNQCRYTIPYLSNLQKKYREQGIVIVGITSGPSDKAKKFLGSLGSPVEYPMATDAKRQTSDAYLKGVGWDELPHSFVIDKEGRLVWHGSATVALEKILDQVLDGSFQLASARRTVTAEKLIREYFQIAMTGAKTSRSSELGEQIIADASGHASILNEFAWRILTDRRIKTPARDYDLALRASRAAYELSGGNEVPIMDTYARALFQAGKRAEAIEMEKKAIAACKDTRFRPELESVLMRFERLSREKPLGK